MEARILEIVAPVAGVGGIALGVFLLLFREVIRKNIFPKLKPEQATRIIMVFMVLVWSVALAGLGAWMWASNGQGIIQETKGNGSPAVAGIGGNVTISSDGGGGRNP